MQSHSDDIDVILEKLYEIKELLIHGLAPSKSDKGEADILADENLFLKYKNEGKATNEIAKLSSSLRLNNMVDSEFKNALARYLKVSFEKGLERPRDEHDKIPMRTFLSSHAEYLDVLKSHLGHEETVKKLREENQSFKYYLQEGEAAGKFKQFPRKMTSNDESDMRRQQLDEKYNKHRRDPALKITTLRKKVDPSEHNQKKLLFLSAEKIKKEQENFQKLAGNPRYTPAGKIKEKEALNLQIKVVSEASELKASKTNLDKDFNDLMSELNGPDSTEESVFNALIRWEKTAFSYMENKKSSSLTDALRFIGRKTGQGKAIMPADNKALKSELKEIFKQCIILSNMLSFIENIKALNQHKQNITRNHSAAHLEEGTVTKQFLHVTEKITAVAEARFGYIKPETLQKLTMTATNKSKL